MNGESPLSKQFLVSFGLIILALVFSLGGAIILALPLGLAGGFFLIKDMLEKMQK